MTDEALQPAIEDFRGFLAGQRAPALVAASLVTVLQSDVRMVSWVVLDWAAKMAQQQPGSNPLEIVLAARNKVFDIFFYRVVRFDQVYRFFPRFEEHLLECCPAAYRPHLQALLEQYPWQQIRPIGEPREQAMYALEKRLEVPVQEDVFNENIYRNVTHNVLSADRRFEFADEQISADVLSYQGKVSSLMGDMVGLVTDKWVRQEIIAANEADKNAEYQNKQRFNLEDYLAQSVDLAVAFFNDDFLPQSCQMLDLVDELARARDLSFEKSQRLQSKATLFSSRKIDEYCSSKLSRVLVGDILNRFTFWDPEKLFQQLFDEPDRRMRRVLLSVLEANGERIYPMLLHQLEYCTPETPWYYIRNLIFLLGRIISPKPAERAQAVALVGWHFHPRAVRQVNAQSIATLSFIGGEAAGECLRARLAEFKRLDDPVSRDLADKIALALVSIDDPASMEASLDHALKHWSDEYVERFAQTWLSPPTIDFLVGRVRAELTKLRRSFALLGNTEAATRILRCLAYQYTNEVRELCQEILTSLTPRNALYATAKQLLETATPAPPPLAVDRMLNRLLVQKHLPEAFVYAWEAGLTGHFHITLTDNTECRVDWSLGRVVHAAVPACFLESDNAFYWLFMLDPREIALAYFDTRTPPAGQNITLETPLLLHEALLQRSELKQISNTAIKPDSSFTRRPIHEALINLKDSSDPKMCRIVWDALAEPANIETLQQRTRLRKYDLYKQLFYLIRQNYVAVDVLRVGKDAAALFDGLKMLDENLKRIRRKPLLFTPYKAVAEICAGISRGTSDETLQLTFTTLGNYFKAAHDERRFLVAAMIDACDRALELVRQYLETKQDRDKKALLDYMGFTFQVPTDTTPVVSEAVVETTLQKLENIQLINDAFDDAAEALFDESSVDDLFENLDAVLTAQGLSGSGSATLDAGLTDHEESMLMELYDNIAVAYVKPLKDFMREIQLNQKIKRRTSLEWIEMIEPSVNLLYGSAEKMGYQKICSALKDMQQALQSQKSVPDQSYFTEAALQQVQSSYERLSQMLPRTFALDLSAADLNSKKEVLIVKFILKQIPEINEKLMNRIILAGLSTFDKFMQSSPDEIAAVTGLSKRQGEDVFMKFYQYRHIYYRHNDEAYRDRFYSMFDVKLSLLRELHLEIEALTNEHQRTKRADLEARIENLKQDRQRLLWGLFILLCIKEEYDLIESIQQSIYDVRIQKLEDYLAKLAKPAA
ncbi:MAG: helix-hairpin-helix domain-containing protein [Acidobacteriota bacterium]